MKKTERENMLLFSKELVAGLHRYRLYFTTLSSLRDETPRVFRLLVRTPFAFNRFELGRVYTLVQQYLYTLQRAAGRVQSAGRGLHQAAANARP